MWSAASSQTKSENSSKVCAYVYDTDRREMFRLVHNLFVMGLSRRSRKYRPANTLPEGRSAWFSGEV